jgi:uncharacterized iron-regulated membrane protein
MRARIRSLLFWTHLGLGLSAGLLILLMCVTGVLLGFERQMIAWIDGAPRLEASGAAPLPLDTTLARLGVARADLATVVMRRDAALPMMLRFRDRERAPLQVDPTQARIVTASGSGKGQAFFSALRRWHRWVGAQGAELRAQMKVVNGTANLIFLALVLSGLYLWWPRRWTRPRLRATLVPHLHAAGRVRDYNWHNALGFWAAIPLALIIASGAFISFRWPGQYLDLALGNAAEKRAAAAALEAPPTASSPAGTPSAERAPVPAYVGAEAALATVVDAVVRTRPDWQQITITMPTGDTDEVRVAVADGNTYRPDQRYTLTLDRESGTLRTSSGYADLSTARKIRAWVRFGHTGEVFGVPGQLIATLATAIGALLVWTGFALAWRRLRHWLRSRRRSVPAVTALPDPTLESPAALG